MTRTNNKLMTMTIAALLSAIGIMIPQFAPKLILEPASFTLASHVPVFIAMFISPVVAIAVAGISTIGFLLSGFPLVVVLRALTHLIFATLGAYILKKNNKLLMSMKTLAPFAIVISLVHAIAEVAVVSFYYWGSGMTTAYYEKGYLISVILLVGLGTIIHSLIDFSIAIFVWKPLQHVVTIPDKVKVK